MTQEDCVASAERILRVESKLLLADSYDPGGLNPSIKRGLVTHLQPNTSSKFGVEHEAGYGDVQRPHFCDSLLCIEGREFR